MVNFSGTENLLAFKGAKLFKGLDEKNPQMLYVCIPVPYNDIEVSRDGERANVGVYMSETSDVYRQACIQRKQQSGDDMTGYIPPSHQAEVRFSREFKDKALEAARRRIISEHPDWQGDMQNPEVNNELKNAMYDAVRIRLGSFYAHVKQGQTRSQPAAHTSAPQGGQQWQPTDSEEVIQVDVDKLPF